MARRRYQLPTPKKHGNWWTILVRKDVFQNGELTRVRERVRLLPAECGEREARRMADEHMRPMNQGMRPAGGALQFQTFIDSMYLPVAQSLQASSTYDRTQGVIENYLIPHFGKLCLHQLTSLTLQTYFMGLDKKLAHESRDKIRDVLSASLRFAVEHGLITSNPAMNVRMPRDKRGRKQTKNHLTPEQFAQFVELIPEPYATMVYVAIFTGLRVSELAALRWEDIHYNSITIDERYCRGDWDAPKSECSNATIAVNRSVIERIHHMKLLTVKVRAGLAIRKYRVVKSDAPGDLVFQSVREGKPLRDNNILVRFLKPAGNKLGLGWVNWRCLRTSHATWLKMAGADVKDAQAQMRHAKASTTLDVYQQFVPASQRIAIDKLTVLAPMAPNGTMSIHSQVIDSMVAREGVEPPTPAFSGLVSATGKRLVA